MSFTHVTFDLDGTVLNTIDDLAAAGNHTCEAHGWPTFSVDEYKHKVGNGMLKLVERFMPEGLAQSDPELFEQVLAEFRAYYGEHSNDATAPYPGIIEMIETLKANDVCVALLTNKDHVSAAPLIAQHFGNECFSVVQGRIPEFPAKPDPAITIHVMEQIDALPQSTLYVGDSNVDILTGHNVHIKACGVLWGFRSQAELLEAGADYIASTPEELAHIILDK